MAIQDAGAILWNGFLRFRTMVQNNPVLSRHLLEGMFIFYNDVDEWNELEELVKTIAQDLNLDFKQLMIIPKEKRFYRLNDPAAFGEIFSPAYTDGKEPVFTEEDKYVYISSDYKNVESFIKSKYTKCQFQWEEDQIKNIQKMAKEIDQGIKNDPVLADVIKKRGQSPSNIFTKDQLERILAIVKDSAQKFEMKNNNLDTVLGKPIKRLDSSLKNFLEQYGLDSDPKREPVKIDRFASAENIFDFFMESDEMCTWRTSLCLYNASYRWFLDKRELNEKQKEKLQINNQGIDQEEEKKH